MLGIFALIAVVGLAAGAVNGLLVTRLGLPSLAVTIGTLALYRGIATILLGPNTVANFPTTYTNLGVNAVPFTGNALTYSAALFIVLAVIFGVVLHATPFGRSLFAMGASAEAARFAGIRVKRIKTILFMVSGLVCALAGVLWTFRLDTAVQNNGLGLELDVVAIVLLAGVSIFGGKGSIVGVVLAVLAFAGPAERAAAHELQPGSGRDRHRRAAAPVRLRPERGGLVRPAPEVDTRAASGP